MNAFITALFASTAFFFASGSTFAQNGMRPREVVVSAKVVSVPAGAAVLRELGLKLDSPAGLSNLGSVPMEKGAEMLAKLEKSAGAVLMSAPSLTTKSGTRATGEMIREFIFPIRAVAPAGGGGGGFIVSHAPARGAGEVRASDRGGWQDAAAGADD